MSRVVSVTPEPVHSISVSRIPRYVTDHGKQGKVQRAILMGTPALVIDISAHVCLLCAEERKHLVAMPAMCRIVSS